MAGRQEYWMRRFNQTLRNENSNQEIRNNKKEREMTRVRFWILACLLFPFLLLALVFIFRMQVLNHHLYLTSAENNRTTSHFSPPTRGVVYDRNGKILATNEAVLSLVLDARIYKHQKKLMVAKLEVLKSLLAMRESSRAAIDVQLQRDVLPPEILVLPKTTLLQQGRFSAHQYQFKGFSIKERLRRRYPRGSLLAHAIGYVGVINKKESERINKVDYLATNVIGKFGIERQYENWLRGTPGRAIVEIDSLGRDVRSLGFLSPKNGRDLRLTFDLSLNKLAFDLLEGRRGSVIAVNPKTGGILAMVSRPSFDLNLFSNGISQKEFKALINAPFKPLFDRAISGAYPPASTIKPIMALTYLKKHILTPQETIWDPGYFKLEGGERKYNNWLRKGHGRLNLSLALKLSNDTYFFGMANRAGIDIVRQAYQIFRFDKKVSDDVFGERKRSIPDDAFKRHHTGTHWYPGDTLNLGIGQGYMASTPLHLAYMISALANPESPKKLHLLLSNKNNERYNLAPLPYSKENLAIVRAAMMRALNEPRGTAYRSFYNAHYKAAGKTGTGQLVSIPQGVHWRAKDLKELQRDHALFVGYAPAKDPQIALIVIVENGIGGAVTAAPIGRKLMDAYLLRPLS